MAQSLQIKNVRYRHQYIADWLIANPERDQHELAEELDLTESHLSVIIHSDAFQEYYQLRREAVHEAVADEVTSRVTKVANLTLDVLETRIERERETVGIGVVRDVAAMSLKALGFGQPSASAAATAAQQNNYFFGNVDRESLAGARDKLRQVQAPTAKTSTVEKDEGTIDGEFERLEAAPRSAS